METVQNTQSSESQESNEVAPVVVPSYQEMFNRAWNGLKGQNWQTCLFKSGDGCSYDGHNGMKCAWGWVDPEGTKDYLNPETGAMKQVTGTVRSLRNDAIGLAALLNDEQIEFAVDLQIAHDRSVDIYGKYDDSMESRMRKVAKKYNLTIPGEESENSNG